MLDQIQANFAKLWSARGKATAWEGGGIATIRSGGFIAVSPALPKRQLDATALQSAAHESEWGSLYRRRE